MIMSLHLTYVSRVVDSKIIFKDVSVMPLMEEYGLRVSASMVLMKIFMPKRDEVEIAYSGASRYVFIKH